jgi:tetratricopeptide (TPR) repeat protein
MASQKAAKDKATAVPPPDAFTTRAGGLLDAARPHAKAMGAIAAAVVIAIAAFGIVRWNKRKAETAATELYHLALLHLAVPLADDLPPGAEPEADDLRHLPATYPDAGGRATAALAVLDALEREHGGTGAAREARLLRAGILLQLGRADEAAAAYRAYAAEADGPALKATALEGVGYALEAKAAAEKDAGARQAGLEAARAAFDAMQPGDGEARARALYHQGRVLVALARPDEARTRFDEALAKDPDPVLKQELDARIASLGAAPPAAPAPEAPAPAPVAAPGAP